ncbi:MAG: hypothetical protein K2Q34_08270 [Alphaproteobacteria bacterium]|nr:hypothetical protein [Alphaproteobacteria bacterium]
MKPFHFLILTGLVCCTLLLFALKDFKRSKIVSVDMNLLVRERAESLAEQNLNQEPLTGESLTQESLTNAIQQSMETLNQDLNDFAKDKKFIVMSSHALKGGAEDVTEEFKAYISHKKGDKA